MQDLFKVKHFLPTVTRSRVTPFFLISLLLIVFFASSVNALTWTRLSGANITVSINTSLVINQTVNNTFILGKAGDQIYLYNNSNTIFFNESKLNFTVNDLISKRNTSGGGGNGSVVDVWVNQTGDNMTGDLVMVDSSINHTSTNITHSSYLDGGWFTFELS